MWCGIAAPTKEKRMELTQVATAIGILGAFGTAIGTYWKNRNWTEKQIQHLTDTKEDKNGLATSVDSLTIEVRLTNQKLDEQGKKIETIFDKAPCFQPGWKRGDC
jgi:peptidoglycan hydrolase CwlO-like protein